MNRTPKKRFDEISVRSRLDALMVDFSLLISSFVTFDCQRQKCQSLLFLVVVLFGEGVEKLGRLGLALLCTIKLASGIEQLISLRCQSAECEVMDLVWLQFFVVGNALNQHYLWSVSMCRWKTHSLCSSRMWSKIIEQKKKSFVVRRIFYLATLPSMFNFSQSNLQNFRFRLFCFESSSMLLFLKSF